MKHKRIVGIAVFGGFALGDLALQQMGFGLVGSLLMGAYIVGSVLPSTMRLLNRWNAREV